MAYQPTAEELQAMIEALPDGKAAGKRFLAELVKREGPEVFVQFAQHISGILDQDRPLRKTDLTDEELTLLAPKVSKLTRRQALGLFAIPAAVMISGLEDNYRLKRYQQLSLGEQGEQRQPPSGTSRIVLGGIAAVAVGGLAARRLIRDDRELQVSLEPMLNAIDELYLKIDLRGMDAIER